MTSLKMNAFIASERNRFDTRDNNLFAFAFSKVTRYYEFLLVISERHKEISKLFLDNLKEFQDSLDKSPGSHAMTQKQMEIQAEGSLITTKLHLEIESFYLFAKILLDQLSRAIEFYFGQANKLSLDSHDLFTKNIQKYSSAKGITLSNDLIYLARKLKEDISDFRDYQIAHHKNPRTVRGTMFDVTGETRMMLHSVYPKPTDKQIESKNIRELLNAIDGYVDEVLIFFQTNSTKTNLHSII